VLPPLPEPGTYGRSRFLRDPLVWLLAAWLGSRILLVVFCIEGVRFHPEETYIGAAASFWRRHLTLLPPFAYQYSPYEGGSIWVNTITAAAQAVMGESLWSLKAPALLLGGFGFAACYRFAEWLAGRWAAVVAGLLMLLPPANILIEELKNDGLHYDATGFLFVGVLAMGKLAAHDRPSRRRLLLTGLLLGVCLSFSYQCFPAFAAASLAWVLARDRGDGDGWARALLWVRQGATLCLGILIGISHHLVHRALLGTGMLGLYAGEAKDAAAMAPLAAWRVPQRFIEVIWLSAYHEADYFRGLPLGITDIVWLAPIILGSFVLLAVLHSSAWFECVAALVPWGSRRATLGAAFGAPWLVLYPVAYTLATDLNPPSFPWHYYPLYPLVAAAMGLLAATLVRLRTEHGRLGTAVALAVALSWAPVFAAHQRGVAVPGGLWGAPSLGLSRGASDIHLARFLIWNWIPRAGSPVEVRDRLLSQDYDLRAELLAMLAHSLRGRLPQGLAEPLEGWDRVAFHRGLRLGEGRALVETPSAPHEWPAPATAASPAEDACARVGRVIAEGILGGRRAMPGPAAASSDVAPSERHWYWFGRGMAVGERLDKDRTNAIFQGRPSPYGPAVDMASEAGEHRVWFLRGLGYALGRGGVLAQHRAIGRSLDEDDQVRLFEGIAMMRREHFVEETATIARVHFSGAAARGFEAGAAAAKEWRRSCMNE
jgi:4-amino-4-deoxy-L-arabinose transferase-like glycosyltransferase